MDRHKQLDILQSQQLSMRGQIVSAATRRDRIRRVIDVLVTNEKKFVEAMTEDFGVRPAEQSQLYDILASIVTLKDAAKHVSKWMKPEKRKVDPMLALMGAKAHIEFQPKGSVGLLSPWNFPLYLTFTPLAGVLAAGNASMIKPSEHTPATSEVMRETLHAAFSPEEIFVITGDAAVAADFSSLPFDHIIFTGSTPVGRHVMRAAAENLVPVTLELGGKSPVIVGEAPNSELMAKRIVTGKLLNAGQICLAPDYLLVNERDEESVISSLISAAEGILPDLTNNHDYTSVLGDRNRERLKEYVNEARTHNAEIIEVGRETADGRLPFTIIRNCPDNIKVMQDEIFGPVLPIITYKDLSEAIAFVNDRPRPLGLYFFGTNKSEERRVLNETVSGGVTLNDVVFHVTVEDLPFGGVGDSGFGVYHGRDGFKTFSHQKSIFTQSKIDVADLAGLRPPYGKKIRNYLRKHISQ